MVLQVFLFVCWTYFQNNAEYCEITPRILHSVNPAQAQSTITLVSGYFPLKESKHSKAEYRAWLRNFLRMSVF